MPKVSVLIPIYNSEKYLEECIESVVSQTLEDIEIILINDGSLDSSEEIIKQYKDNPKVKVINKNNSGYGASLNIGIKEAKGEYISIIEADDFVHNDMLEVLYSKRGYDVIKGGFCFYPENKLYRLSLDGEYLIDDYPQMLNLKPSVWSAIYKKEFLIKNNIFFNETKGASYQDISFHFKTMYLADKIYFMDEPFYFYRTDNAQSSVNAKNKALSVIEEFKSIDKFLLNKTILPETSAQLALFRLRAYIWNYMRISKTYENDFIKNAQIDLKERNNSFFYKSEFVGLKEKIKLFLFINCPYFFKFILSIVKKYTK